MRNRRWIEPCGTRSSHFIAFHRCSWSLVRFDEFGMLFNYRIEKFTANAAKREFPRRRGEPWMLLESKSLKTSNSRRAERNKRRWWNTTNRHFMNTRQSSSMRTVSGVCVLKLPLYRNRFLLHLPTYERIFTRSAFSNIIFFSSFSHLSVSVAPPAFVIRIYPHRNTRI